MSTLIPSSQEPVTLEDKTPTDTPRPVKQDNPSFVLHGIDNVKYEEVSGVPLGLAVADGVQWGMDYVGFDLI